MANIDRRTFLRASTAVAAGAIAPDLALATDNNNKELMASPPTTTPEITKIVARYVVSARYEDLPVNVRKEGIRTLLNWVGVAVGGSHHKTINIAVEVLSHSQGRPKHRFLDVESVSTS
jgi:MmgE/PrpD N-terminal domain